MHQGKNRPGTDQERYVQFATATERDRALDGLFAERSDLELASSAFPDQNVASFRGLAAEELQELQGRLGSGVKVDQAHTGKVVGGHQINPRVRSNWGV